MIKPKGAPEYKRRLILEDRINAGETVKGIRGFTPAETKCCQVRTKLYIAVEVVAIELGDCEFSVVVKPLPMANVIQIGNHFTVSPKAFFIDEDDVMRYEDHQNRLADFGQSMQPFKYTNSTLTRKRQLFQEALAKAPERLRLEIEAEYTEDKGGAKKLPDGLLEQFYRQLMVAKFFPNAGEEYNPYDDESDYDDE